MRVMTDVFVSSKDGVELRTNRGAGKETPELTVQDVTLYFENEEVLCRMVDAIDQYILERRLGDASAYLR